MARLGLDGAVRLAHEETGTDGLIHGRPEKEGDLPRFREVAVEDLKILSGEEDPATGVGVEPAERLKVPELRVSARFLKQPPQSAVVLFREEEARSSCVPALDGPPGLDENSVPLASAEQDASDLNASVRNALEAFISGAAHLLHDGQ